MGEIWNKKEDEIGNTQGGEKGKIGLVNMEEQGG